MENLSSEDDYDHRDDRFESYADVSSSESCASFSYDLCAAATTSLTSSPVSGPQLALDSDLPDLPPILLPVIGDRHVVIPLQKPKKPVVTTELTEVELMKARFAKLLLGEDMSGGGKGVCAALAISNAITNLSATVFGDLWKLEPLAPQRKSLWTRDMEWLLSVSDSIVELTPSLQEFPGGGTFEVMVPQPRSDLYMNLPVLKKLDAMLVSMLDGFCESDFYYVDRGVIVAGGEYVEGYLQSPSSGSPSIRLEEKWWLPFPKVPPNGLDEDTTKRLQQSRECTNHIFKAALAINRNVLSQMEIPNVYLTSLPKSAKACLGETLYRYINAAQFSPERLLYYLELSSEYTTLEIANKIEAAVHIWRQKYIKRNLNHGKSGRSSLGSTVKGFVGDRENSKLLAHRAETLLQNLKLQFSGLPQTILDMNKIQFNKDVGQSILESYSRVLESIAFNLMARIDDLLYIDDATKRCRAVETAPMLAQRDSTTSLPLQKPISPILFSSPRSPIMTTPVCGSSNSKNGSPNRRCFVRTSSLRDPLNSNFERLTF